MKRTFTWGLTNGQRVVATSNDKNHWDDPTYAEMYPAGSIIRVARHSS